MSSRAAIFWGALLAGAAVALGAYAAHGLGGRALSLGYEVDLAKRLAWFETGAKYQMYHALALILAGILAEQREQLRTLKVASVLFVVGIALFSGSLYAMTFLSSQWSKLGAVTPLGGLAFIAGWICLALGSKR